MYLLRHGKSRKKSENTPFYPPNFPTRPGGMTQNVHGVLTKNKNFAKNFYSFVFRHLAQKNL
jgi:hypothetical protein